LFFSWALIWRQEKQALGGIIVNHVDEGIMYHPPLNGVLNGTPLSWGATGFLIIAGVGCLHLQFVF
jgi:hypothetical protein